MNDGLRAYLFLAAEACAKAASWGIVWGMWDRANSKRRAVNPLRTSQRRRRRRWLVEKTEAELLIAPFWKVRGLVVHHSRDVEEY